MPFAGKVQGFTVVGKERRLFVIRRVDKIRERLGDAPQAIWELTAQEQIALFALLFATGKEQHSTILVQAPRSFKFIVYGRQEDPGLRKFRAGIFPRSHVNISELIDVIEINIHLQAVGAKAHNLFVESGIYIAAGILRLLPFSAVGGADINIAAAVSVDLHLLATDIVLAPRREGQHGFVAIDEGVIIGLIAVHVFAEILKSNIAGLTHQLYRILALPDIPVHFELPLWLQGFAFLIGRDGLSQLVIEVVGAAQVKPHLVVVF